MTSPNNRQATEHNSAPTHDMPHTREEMRQADRRTTSLRILIVSTTTVVLLLGALALVFGVFN